MRGSSQRHRSRLSGAPTASPPRRAEPVNSPLPSPGAEYSKRADGLRQTTMGRHADLRVRVWGVRGALRGAGRDGKDRRLSQLRRRAQSPALLGGLAARAPAARRRGALGRIAAAGAGGGAAGPDYRVAEAAGGGGEAVSASAEERRERLVEL